MKPNVEKEKSLLHSRLLELVIYHQDSGKFISRISRGPLKAGARIGCTDMSSGYRTIMIDKVRFMEHRLAWFYVTGSWPEEVIDHIDGVKDNNIFSSLRAASYRQNSSNKVNNSKLGHNITEQHGNFMVTIRANGKVKSFGTYDTLTKAKYIRDMVLALLEKNEEIPDRQKLKDISQLCVENTSV